MLTQFDEFTSSLAQRTESVAARLTATLADEMTLIEDRLGPLVTFQWHERFHGPLRTWLAVSDFLHFGCRDYVARLLSRVPHCQMAFMNQWLAPARAPLVDDVLRGEAQAIQDLLHARGLPIGRWRIATAQIDATRLMAEIAADIDIRMHAAASTAAAHDHTLVWTTSAVGGGVPLLLALGGLYFLGRDLFESGAGGVPVLGYLLGIAILFFVVLQAMVGVLLSPRSRGGGKIGEEAVHQAVARTIEQWLRSYRSDLEADLVGMHEPLKALQSVAVMSRGNLPMSQQTRGANDDGQHAPSSAWVIRSETNQRENNEDSFQVFPLMPAPESLPVMILAVADGMGGHAYGEHASREALRRASLSLFESLVVERSINCLEAAIPIDVEILSQALMQALQQASAHVRRMADTNKWGKAGSTVVMAAIMADTAVVVNLGDSPLFHYQNASRRLTKITEDHTVAGALMRAGMITPEMARVHEGRSVLEFYVGGGESLPGKMPLHQVTLAPGDLLCLCSDGVSSLIGENQMEAIFGESSDDLERMAEQLITTAQDAGETDNQTLIVWRHRGQETQETEREIPPCGGEWSQPLGKEA
jgi:protein phosphatase